MHSRINKPTNRAGAVNPRQKVRKNMRYYEIEYKVNGKTFTTVEMPTTNDGKRETKDKFLQKVLNRIESLVMAGAVVTNLTEGKLD